METTAIQVLTEAGAVGISIALMLLLYKLFGVVDDNTRVMSDLKSFLEETHESLPTKSDVAELEARMTKAHMDTRETVYKEHRNLRKFIREELKQ